MTVASLLLAGLVALAPLLAAAVALTVPAAAAGWIAAAGSILAFALACRLPWAQGAGRLLLVDPLSAFAALLVSFVGMTTIWFARGRSRERNALHLALVGLLLLALLANSLALAWAAMEGALVAAALALALPATAAARAAAWRLLVTCSAGLALALFGSVTLGVAAPPALGPGLGGESWTALATAASHATGPLTDLAFAFLLVGYGTAAGLAPLHGWLPDAEGAVPAPPAALLSSVFPVVPLVLLLRLRLAAPAHMLLPPAAVMMALGLCSLLFAAFALPRGRDVARALMVSSVGQSGVVAFAFGLGGAAATFGGLLQLAVHAVVKSALYQCAAAGAPLEPGLLARRRGLALTFAAGIVALAALPPFGLFSSSFLILVETARRLPLLALLLGLGLAVSAAALMRGLVTVCLGPAEPAHSPALPPAVLLPAWLSLALALLLGLALPQPLAAWLMAIGGGPP
jgi:hydrogenase-4 component F